MNEVLKLLKQRREQVKRGHSFEDSAKIGLVIEGGGMRGVVSAGMVAGLEMLGLTKVFDYVAGSSAGIINGAYFIAGQAQYGTTIYYQNANNNRFINPLRSLIGKPVLDLDYLLNHVLEKDKPLNFEAILRSKTKLVAVASSITQRKPIYISDFSNKEELKLAMRASIAIPIASGKPVEYSGDLLWDALVNEPIPIFAALASKCTHILLLLTQPKSIFKTKPNWIATQVNKILVRSNAIWQTRNCFLQSNKNTKDYLSRNNPYNPLLKSFWSTAENGYWQFLKDYDSAYILPVAVNYSTSVTGTMKSSNLLLEAAKRGCEALIKTIEGYEPQIVEQIQAYQAYK